MRWSNVADWHPEDIKSAVRKRGTTLADIARASGLTGGALRLALVKPREQAEAAIADFLGIHPMKIWPSRYMANGERMRPQPVDNYRSAPRFGNPARRARKGLSHIEAKASC